MINNKGSIMIYGVGFMLALTIIILALALAPVMKERVELTRTSMDCDNESISEFTKAGCFVTDISMFQFIGGLIFIAGAVLTAKAWL